MNLRHQWQAWGELWRRYRDHFAYAWRERRALTPRDLNSEEAEFSPAALSLQEKPVSPTGRWVAKILILWIVVAITWSILGHVDIVVNAVGKVIPSGYSKALASVEVARVRALHVTEGQTVHAGDVLVELDSRTVDSDLEKARGGAAIAASHAAGARALIAAVDSDRPPVLAPNSGVPRERWHETEQNLNGQWHDYVAKRRRLEGEISHAEAALPLAVERERDYAQLSKEDDVSRDAYLKKKQERIDLQAQLIDARNQRAVLIAETRKTALDALDDAERVLNDATKDAARAEAHGDLLKLVAPVDGTVQQLAVHTIGGVVPAAVPLMKLVPTKSKVEVEAFIESKDVGFVREGQSAAVKIDAFEYIKYGTVAARVTHVSHDAIKDEKRGLIYSVKVMLDRPTMEIDGRSVALTPGMGVSVEIKTGTRRVIEYVLSPLIEESRESLHER
ncbi:MULTISPECIES: HlyD family type I secretion periplasmic adaptor subunit [unclassified Paraburkholderia]|uniref:HlyD family type I secretion periplasmic adaptor subunit n=1 Tax=unclassified Paraburkholderia TaxID=2615204 RepID=UPI0034CD0E9D